MKPFSQSPRCEKCGGTDVRKEYFEPGACQITRHTPCDDVGVEHLHDYCQTCHYQWAESIWPGEPAPKVEPPVIAVTYSKPTCPHCGAEMAQEALRYPWPYPADFGPYWYAHVYSVTP
jgi:hypothetical protein